MKRYLTLPETLVTTALLIVCAIFYFEARKLPAGTFDPLGPGAAPEMVSGLLVALCLFVLIRRFRNVVLGKAFKEEAAVDAIKREGTEEKHFLAVFFVMLLAYLVAFQLELGHFIVLTIPFVFASIVFLGGTSKRVVVTAAITSCVLSVGLFYVMTELFVIRLPGT